MHQKTVWPWITCYPDAGVKGWLSLYQKRVPFVQWVCSKSNASLRTSCTCLKHLNEENCNQRFWNQIIIIAQHVKLSALLHRIQRSWNQSPTEAQVFKEKISFRRSFWIRAIGDKTQVHTRSNQAETNFNTYNGSAKTANGSWGGLGKKNKRSQVLRKNTATRGTKRRQHWQPGKLTPNRDNWRQVSRKGRGEGRRHTADWVEKPAYQIWLML